MESTSNKYTQAVLRLVLVLSLLAGYGVSYGQPVQEGGCADCTGTCYCCELDCSTCRTQGTGFCNADEYRICGEDSGENPGDPEAYCASFIPINDWLVILIIIGFSVSLFFLKRVFL